MVDSASEIFSTNLDRVSFGEKSENTEMFGGLFVLLASWGFGGNILLCALIYQGNLWTMMNRGLMAVSMVRTIISRKHNLEKRNPIELRLSFFEGSQATYL